MDLTHIKRHWLHRFLLRFLKEPEFAFRKAIRIKFIQGSEEKHYISPVIFILHDITIHHRHRVDRIDGCISLDAYTER